MTPDDDLLSVRNDLAFLRSAIEFGLVVWLGPYVPTSLIVAFICIYYPVKCLLRARRNKIEEKAERARQAAWKASQECRDLERSGPWWVRPE